MDPNAVPEDDDHDEGELPNGVSGAAHPAPEPPPPDVPPTVEEAERKNKRAEKNADRRASGEKRVGFMSHTAAEKWEDEILPYLREKLMLEPAGVRIDVYQIDPPARGGGPKKVGHFFGSDVDGRAGNGAGAAFTDYFIDNLHLPLNIGAARYKVIFRRVQGGGPIGDGEESFGTPQEINDVRTAQNAARNRRNQQGYTAPYQPGVGAPPPPPQWGPPPVPPAAAPAPAPAPVAAPPGSPPVDRFTQYLMDEVNRMRAQQGQQPISAPAPAPPPPPPPQSTLGVKEIADVVNAVLDERDKRAAAAAAAEPSRGGVDRGRSLMQDLRDMWALRNGFDKFIGEAAVGMGFGKPHVSGAPNPDGSYNGEVVDDPPPDAPPPADEGVPFVVEEIPGSNYHGERVRWVTPRPGRKLDFMETAMAWASANPTIAQDVAGRVVNVVEKVVNATTFDANGEQQPKVEQPDGRGGWSGT